MPSMAARSRLADDDLEPTSPALAPTS